jgi:hypothetical protein
MRQRVASGCRYNAASAASGLLVSFDARQLVGNQSQDAPSNESWLVNLNGRREQPFKRLRKDSAFFY